MLMKFVRLRPEARIPARATDGAAGYDLCACLDAPVTLAPGARRLIPTGVAVQLPAGTAGMVYARSGLAVRAGVTLANSVGVVESDYTGELRVGLINLSAEPYTVESGDRIAQLVVTPVLTPDAVEVDRLDETARGDGGFGSTGR